MDGIARARQFRALNYQGEATSVWHRLPVARRASVFVLLFLGNLGELRVVLTKRSSQLRSFPGHISLPGGKADTGLESPWMVARRETSEEIGLSEHDDVLQRDHGISIDKVTELPCYLSRAFSAVRPCVAFMNAAEEEGIMRSLELKVNPGESSSIFSCPLEDFLYPESATKGPEGKDKVSRSNVVKRTADEVSAKEAIDRTFHRMKWGGIPWNLRSYTFPQANPEEVHWLQGFEDLSATESEGEESAITTDAEPSRAVSTETEVTDATRSSESLEAEQDSAEPPRKKRLTEWGKLGSRRHSITNEKIYDVWGLTANILHDLAEMVYLDPSDRVPNKHYGEEELIWSVWHHGNQMRTKERSEIESRLISAGPQDNVSFGDLLPRTEFNRLKRIYKI